MKNDRLDALTEKARDAFKALPDDLMLRGDGEYLDNGVVMRKSDVLERMHQARELIGEVHRELIDEPRRKVKAKGQGEETAQ